MTEKELISKLNSLKNINPDQNWLNSNRELLLSQISNSGATELSVWKTFIINLESLAKTSLQPAVAFGVFALVLISGSLFGQQLFTNAKPNDSLYIARIVSEKAKLSLVFNSEAREKMAVQFASNHAQDIASTLADPQFDQAANQDQVAKLNESFNKEVETVKNRVDKLATVTDKNPTTKITANPDDQIFSASENNKDNQGIQVGESREFNPMLTFNTSSTNPAVLTATPTLLTTGLTTTTTTTAPTVIEEDSPANKILDEAKQLFEKKDYTKALDKLKEVDQIIK
ncbi:MAG: hypothetical protein WC523_06620 [Patescibacteria group bacterium]|jgi:hypothetical protein